MDSPLINPSILAHLPQRQFLLTSGHCDLRTGLITSWVAPCSDEPILLTVSIPRGSLVEPLIRDSQAFTLALMPEDDRVLARRFHDGLERTDDPFVGLDLHKLPLGGLAPQRCPMWIECQLAGHLAPDSGHHVYLGEVCSTNAKLQSTRKRSA